MRVFIAFCLLATAYGQPQGYSYQQQQQQHQQSGGFQIKLPGIPLPSAPQQYSSSVQQQGHSLFQEALQSAKVSQSFLGSAHNTYVPPSAPALPPPPAPPQNFYRPPQPQYHNFQQPAFHQPQQPFVPIQTPPPQQQYQQPAFYQPPPVVTKDIYVHVAPEEPEDHYRPPPPPVPPPPRKHYRIVFIKAPTPTVSPATVRVNQAPTEEKTIIYVLTKKPDPLDLDAAFQEVAPKPPSKPEVYFIKYRTQEEAQHAQRTIQAQYDQLGGTTQVSDEGVAPVTSVIGSLDQQQGAVGPAHTGPGFSSTGSGSGSVSASANGSGSSYASGSSSGIGTGSGGSIGKYLPPIVTI